MRKLETVDIRVGPYRVVPMRISHALSMRKWGSHDSALYREYNYADLTDAQMHGWHAVRSTKSNFYYAILEGDACIGFIGLKEMNFLRRGATLGFAIDKNRIGEGLGSRVMAAFLPVYFGLGFNAMNLFVYGYNTRAFNLYTKLGFSVIEKTVEEIRNPDNFPSEAEVEENPDAFIRLKESYLLEVYQMRLTRAEARSGGDYEV